MVDDVLLNKAATIERCINRVREEYAKAESNIAMHDYQALLLPIVENIIMNLLDDFVNFSKQLLQHK